MVALAKREQIITSSHTADALPPWLRTRMREVDTLTVKGKSKDIGIFELLWQDEEADLTAMAIALEAGAGAHRAAARRAGRSCWTRTRPRSRWAATRRTTS